jgi:hypothetical protein
MGLSGTLPTSTTEALEWRLKRLRKEPLKEGTIAFICNNPYKKRRKLFAMRSSAAYHPEILWEEIQSWLQELHEDSSREALSY